MSGFIEALRQVLQDACCTFGRHDLPPWRAPQQTVRWCRNTGCRGWEMRPL